MRQLSIKSKITLVVSALFVAFAAIISSFTLHYLEREYLESLTQQQYALATSLAANIDDKLIVAKKSLVSGASHFPREGLRDAEGAQRYLDNKTTLHTLFDNGLFLFSLDGRLLVESPFLPDRRGRDISFREYYKKTVSSGTPIISAPYFSSHSPDQPAVMVTAPVLDKSGRMVAFLGGSVRLWGENMLGQLSRVKVGETGYVYLFSSDRMLIMHPDRSRIMKPAAPPGVNLLFDRAVAGYEGSGETTTSRGLRVFSSFRHLQSTDWTLAVNYPVVEAYAPFISARRAILIATASGVVVVLVVVWLLTRYLTAPLVTFTGHIKGFQHKSGGQRRFVIDSGDEIGTLAEAFNGLVETLERQQQALRESETNFRALAENANDGMIIVSGEGTVVYANRQAERVTTSRSGALVGTNVETLLRHDEQKECLELSRHLLGESEPPGLHETIVVRRDGTPVPAEITCARTVWQGASAVLIIFRDISARKQAEEQVLQLNAELELRVRQRTAELEASNRELEAFSYSVSHDLRAPLRSMSAFSSIISENCSGHLDDDSQLALERIGSSAVRMGQLIDDLLLLSRVTRGQLVREQVDLSALAREIVKELSTREPERQVAFVIQDGIKGEGDARLLRVVLVNLLENAWKFSSSSTGARIELGSYRHFLDIVYYIRDNGVGFDMAYAHKLFGPFQRLHGINDFPGTGIGLATVQRIIQRHGGTIWPESEIGKGATFYFTLQGADRSPG